jgi:hypothetical protein
MTPTGSNREHRRGRSTGPERAGQSGASLIIALTFLLVFSTVSAALLAQGFTSQSSTSALQTVQGKDAAGDGAIEVAIDRLTGLYNTNPNPVTNATYRVDSQGRDPALFPNDPPCVFNVLSTLKDPTTGALLKITTTCSADRGSLSGKPPGGPLPTDTPMWPRVVTIDACLRNQAVVDTQTAACGQVAGDKMLVQALVRFDVTIDATGDESGVAGSPAANLPEVLEWDHVLLDQTA